MHIDLVPARTVDVGGLRLTTAGGTCVGNRYPANFDRLAVDPHLPLLAVADGMGGGRGSAVAAGTAIDVFMSRARAHASDGRPGPVALRSAVADAQSRVRAAGAELGELTGCTLTAMLAPPSGAGEPGQAWIVQIGDSRAYRLRGALLELLTVDHTMAWLGAVYGWYPADSPEAHAARYQLTRYVGHPADPEPDVLHVELRPGDVYCLCTDGVAEQVPYDRLTQLLASPGALDATASRLLADTLAAGGRDNATVALLRAEV